LTAPLVAPSTRQASLGPLFDRWFQGCVTRPASDRFQTASEAILALAEALSVPLTPSVAPPRLESMRPSSRPSLGVASLSLRTASAGAFSTSAIIEPTAARPAWRRFGWVAVAAAAAFVLVLAAAVVVPRVASRSPKVVALAPPVATQPDEASSATAPAASAVTIAAEADAADIPTSVPGAPKDPPAKVLTRSQQERIGVLERLCGQGTFTPRECSAKKLAILRQP
jgi:eukaryotic-like serine/threonine-protein kinase